MHGSAELGLELGYPHFFFPSFLIFFFFLPPPFLFFFSLTSSRCDTIIIGGMFSVGIGEVGVFRMGKEAALSLSIISYYFARLSHARCIYRAGSEIGSAIMTIKAHLCRRDQRVTKPPERCRPIMSSYLTGTHFASFAGN